MLARTAEGRCLSDFRVEEMAKNGLVTVHNPISGWGPSPHRKRTAPSPQPSNRAARPWRRGGATSLPRSGPTQLVRQHKLTKAGGSSMAAVVVMSCGTSAQKNQTSRHDSRPHSRRALGRRRHLSHPRSLDGKSEATKKERRHSNTTPDQICNRLTIALDLTQRHIK